MRELLRVHATPWIGFALVGIIWITTALLQVPMHGRLARGFSQAAHRRRVSSNWIRTIAWSAWRGGTWLVMVRATARPGTEES